MAPDALPTEPDQVVTADDAQQAKAAITDLETVERLVTAVLVVLGVGGLIFTAVNVTQFAKDHHVHWAISWMLDPLVSVSLLAALFIDGKLSAHGYRPGGWPFALRWFAGLATWLMNCWGSLYPDTFTGWPTDLDPAGLLLHSVIPVLVIFLAEAGAGYRKFSVSRKAEHRTTLSDWRDQQARRERAKAAARTADAEARAATAEREAAEASRLARQAAEASERRKAEAAAAELRRQQIAAAADAEERKIRAQAEADERRITAEAQREEVRRQAAVDEAKRRETAEAVRAENERRTEAERARIDRENAEHAAELERQRIIAEAQAEALRTEAEARAAADRSATEAKVQAAAERRAKAAEVSAGTSAETGRAAARMAKVVQRGSAEADAVKGAEAKRRRNEEATFEAAVLIFLDEAPTRAEFGARYAMSESWARGVYADADDRMKTDDEFQTRVLAGAETRTAPALAHSA